MEIVDLVAPEGVIANLKATSKKQALQVLAGEHIAHKFGDEMLAKLEAAGLRFTAGRDDSKAAAE